MVAGKCTPIHVGACVCALSLPCVEFGDAGHYPVHWQSQRQRSVAIVVRFGRVERNFIAGHVVCLLRNVAHETRTLGTSHALMTSYALRKE